MINLFDFVLDCTRLKVPNLNGIFAVTAINHTAARARVNRVVTRPCFKVKRHIAQARDIDFVVAFTKVRDNRFDTIIRLIPTIKLNTHSPARAVKRDFFARILGAEILPRRRPITKVQR